MLPHHTLKWAGHPGHAARDSHDAFTWLVPSRPPGRFNGVERDPPRHRAPADNMRRREDDVMTLPGHYDRARRVSIALLGLRAMASRRAAPLQVCVVVRMLFVEFGYASAEA